MIHDHDATKAVIRAGGLPDYTALANDAEREKCSTDSECEGLK